MKLVVYLDVQMVELSAVLMVLMMVVLKDDAMVERMAVDSVPHLEIRLVVQMELRRAERTVEKMA